jgi:hypothetical protein
MNPNNPGEAQDGTAEQTPATNPIFINDHLTHNPDDISWVVGEDQPDPIEVPIEEIKELDKEVEASESEGQEEQPKKKRGNKVTSQRRIADLNRKLKEAQSFAYTIMSQKEALEKRLTRKEQESLDNYEKSLVSDKERILQAMVDAEDEGDTVKKVKATDLLNQYNSEIMDVQRKREKAAHTVPPKNDFPTDIFEDTYENQVDEEIHQVGQEWMSRNAWANPQSPHFNQELWAEADQYSKDLAKAYQLEGADEEIGSPEFFDEISSYMRSSYNVGRERPSTQKTGSIRMRNPGTQVSPVQRTIPGKTSPSGRTPITLSAQEREIAHSMRGFVKDQKTGQKIYDNAGLEAHYARNVRR